MFGKSRIRDEMEYFSNPKIFCEYRRISRHVFLLTLKLTVMLTFDNYCQITYVHDIIHGCFTCITVILCIPPRQGGGGGGEEGCSRFQI